MAKSKGAYVEILPTSSIERFSEKNIKKAGKRARFATPSAETGAALAEKYLPRTGFDGRYVKGAVGHNRAIGSATGALAGSAVDRAMKKKTLGGQMASTVKKFNKVHGPKKSQVAAAMALLGVTGAGLGAGLGLGNELGRYKREKQKKSLEQNKQADVINDINEIYKVACERYY